MHDERENQGEPAEETPEDRPWWQPNLSLIVIALLLIGVALTLPQGAVDAVHEAVAPEKIDTAGVFSEQVAHLDRALAHGAPVDADAARAALHDLQLRRIVGTGPIAGEELGPMKKRLQAFSLELASAETPSQKRALRSVQITRLARDHPRLVVDAVVDALETLDAQIDAASASSR